MEYEARKLRWYWIVLLIIYSFGVIYFVLKSNPLLYSQNTLKSAQQVQTATQLNPQPAPEQQFQVEEDPRGNEVSWPFLSLGNLNMTSPEVTRNKSYTEFKAHPLNRDLNAADIQILSHTKDLILIKDNTNQIYKFTALGELEWHYGLSKEADLSQTLLDSAFAYLIQRNGTITALDLKTGRPQWTLRTEQAIGGEPWLETTYLIFPAAKIQNSQANKSSKKATTSLLKIDRKTGAVKSTHEGFEFKEPFKEVLVPGTDLRLAYQGSQVVAYNKNLGPSLQVQWTTGLPENISKELVAYDGQVFAITEGKRLYVLNARKKGEVSIDMDLDIYPAGNVTYIPEMNRLAYLGETGTLRVVDLKKKEMAWRFDLSIQGPLRDLWSSRLKGAYIQEFGMRWVDKGWTIWSPCRASMFCVYNPERGQLIQRVELSAPPIATPVVLDDKIIALLRGPNGQLQIAHLLEPAELRKAQAESEQALLER